VSEYSLSFRTQQWVSRPTFRFRHYCLRQQTCCSIDRSLKCNVWQKVLYIVEQLQTWYEVSVSDNKVRGEWENFEYLVYPDIAIAHHLWQAPSIAAETLADMGMTSLACFDFASQSGCPNLVHGLKPSYIIKEKRMAVVCTRCCMRYMGYRRHDKFCYKI